MIYNVHEILSPTFFVNESHSRINSPRNTAKAFDGTKSNKNKIIKLNIFFILIT